MLIPPHAGHASHATYACALSRSFMHLMTRCCKIKRDDIKANRKKLAADWSPAANLEQLWIRARERQDFAATAGEPVPEGEMIGTLLGVIKTAGVFATGCCEWRKRPTNEHALANFKEHFRAARADALIAGLGDAQWDGACQSSQPC
jgi:hypothetical protein